MRGGLNVLRFIHFTGFCSRCNQCLFRFSGKRKSRKGGFGVRKTKFMAFLKEDKILAPVQSICFPLGSNSGKDLIIMDCWFSIDEVELLQYTGLKDKNGHEIYEGYIVKCSSGCPHTVILKQEHRGTYFGGMPTWYLSGLNEGYAWSGEEELIGNIYENPELLEERSV